MNIIHMAIVDDLRISQNKYVVMGAIHFPTRIIIGQIYKLLIATLPPR